VTRINETAPDATNTRAIRKVTSSEPLTKQAMRKKLLYTKNTYI
jgi:hypothetical protein